MGEPRDPLHWEASCTANVAPHVLIDSVLNPAARSKWIIAQTRVLIEPVLFSENITGPGSGAKDNHPNLQGLSQQSDAVER